MPVGGGCLLGQVVTKDSFSLPDRFSTPCRGSDHSKNRFRYMSASIFRECVFHYLDPLSTVDLFFSRFRAAAHTKIINPNNNSNNKEHRDSFGNSLCSAQVGERTTAQRPAPFNEFPSWRLFRARSSTHRTQVRKSNRRTLSNQNRRRSTSRAPQQKLASK